jgi:nucleolar pre-ribosomal-associated protein 1
MLVYACLLTSSYSEHKQSINSAIRPCSIATLSSSFSQWPFVVKSGGAAAESAVGAWIASLLGHLKLAGENTKALKAARDKLCEAAGDKKTKSLLKKALKASGETKEDDSKGETTQQTPSAPSNLPSL